MRKHSKFTELLFSVLFFILSLSNLFFFFFLYLPGSTPFQNFGKSFFLLHFWYSCLVQIHFIYNILPFLEGYPDKSIFEAHRNPTVPGPLVLLPNSLLHSPAVKAPRPRSVLVSALCAFHLADALLFSHASDATMLIPSFAFHRDADTL